MRATAGLVVAGLALTLVAAAGAARITGTKHADLILGSLRVDRVSARGGADRIDVAGGGADRVSCGPAADLVAADSLDRLSADCEVVSRRISVDRYSGGGAIHATEAEPDTYSWGSTVVAAFQVARFQNGGALNIGFAVSRDAGRTWTNGLLPGLTVRSRPRGSFARASDPSVAYDALHGVWLIASLAFSNNESALVVSTSPDGAHWSDPYVAGGKPNAQDGIVFDKEWIACDNGASSPFRGHCYLSYSDIENVRLATQTSVDGGRTWSAPAGSPDNAGRRGILGPAAPAPQPVSLPNGVLSVPLFDDGIYVVTSANGGASFSSESLVARSRFYSSNRLRSGPFPSVEVGAGGIAYMAWADCGQRARCTGNDLVLSRSTDGAAWTPPATIPLGPGNHVIDGLAADPDRPGRIAVAYYTESTRKLDVRMAWSSDGGASWSRQQLVSPERMSYTRIAHSSGAMVGDYISTSFAGGRAIAVFALAQSKLRGRLRQAMYAASLAVP